MATTNLEFGAQVDAWVAESKARVTAVFHEATQRTVSLAQLPVAKGGNMPVDTGFLRYGIRASLSAMPPVIPTHGVQGAHYEYSPGEVLLVINQAKLGETIYIGYMASYAAYVEYGTSKRPARGFVGNAALQWQTTVNQVVENLKARAGAGPTVGPSVQPPL